MIINIKQKVNDAIKCNSRLDLVSVKNSMDQKLSLLSKFLMLCLISLVYLSNFIVCNDMDRL